jgi:hypothetical protein
VDVEEQIPQKPKSKKGKRAKREPSPEVTSRFRGFWIVVAGMYLVTVWLDGVGSNVPAKLTPRPWLYFAQVAALFVTAAPKVIDYRAEGWSCSERRWTEIDVRPYFRIDRDNKENRFQRALQFYRKNRTVMRALEEFVVKRSNASGGALIGGVRFSSLRLSYPAPGEHVAPYERLPLATYSGEQRHDWYWTPKSRRTERCGQRPDPSDGVDESDRPRDQGGSKDSDRESDP